MKITDSKSLGQAIRVRRKELNYTQAYLSEFTGLSITFISDYKWISGRSLPSLDNFVILSKILHTSIEDILVIDGDIVHLWGDFKLTVQ